MRTECELSLSSVVEERSQLAHMIAHFKNSNPHKKREQKREQKRE